MKFLGIYRPAAPEGTPPPQEHMAEMGKLIDEMTQAGVLLATEGCLPSSKGARVRFDPSGSRRSVTDGPFPETKELIAGYAILQVRSKEEAIEWVKRMPHPHPGEETEVEIRALYELADLHALHEKK